MKRKVPLFFRLAGVMAFLAIFSGESAGQVPDEAEARLRAIYERGEFRARSFRAVWDKDGSGYTVLERASGSDKRELVRYDTAGGRRSVLASLSQLTPQGTSEPLSIERYAFSPDGSWVLLQTSREEGEKRVADYWKLDLEAGILQRVIAGVSPVSSSLARSLSPDGRRFLYVDDGNLYTHDLGLDWSIPLTVDGEVDTVTNGRAVWSPDGKWIAYVQSDSSKVRLRPMLIPGDPTYPKVEYVRFARIGETIPTLRVGVVAAHGGKTRWLDILAPPEGFYLGQVSWAGNSRELLVEKLSRGRDKREFLIAEARTGKVTCIYSESDPAWVVASYRRNAGLEWIRDGRAFLVLSEKDGWRRAYVYSREGKELGALTPSGVDIIERGVVDEAGGWFYYYASPHNATQRYLYRVSLDGNGKPERVTPEDQPGTHNYAFSPDAKWAFHTSSAFDTPPVTELVKLPGHKVVRVIEENKELRAKIKSMIARPAEFIKIDLGDGVVMDAWMIKPRDFDPSRKYPVFVYVYGEPHAQTVLDSWSTTNIYHRVIADLGYLVISIDNRGTPAPKGAAWRRAVFGSLGPLSTEEQAAGLLELARTKPYVDLSRVGIWGWSGGGSNTLNAMFRKPEIYHVGIAVAPKPQPHLYNAWFQEIYMRTPAQNPEGYRKSAPINYAEGLKGNLLIIHGTGETNTHIQITEGLVDRLIQLGKAFDYMTYPNRNHGLREGLGTSLHLRLLMVRYLLSHLPPGPK